MENKYNKMQHLKDLKKMVFKVLVVTLKSGLGLCGALVCFTNSQLTKRTLITVKRVCVRVSIQQGLLTVRKTDASSRITEYTRPLLLMNTWRYTETNSDGKIAI